jgi:predicted GNAT family acetyltransferase
MKANKSTKSSEKLETINAGETLIDPQTENTVRDTDSAIATVADITPAETLVAFIARLTAEGKTEDEIETAVNERSASRKAAEEMKSVQFLRESIIAAEAAIEAIPEVIKLRKTITEAAATLASKGFNIDGSRKIVAKAAKGTGCPFKGTLNGTACTHGKHRSDEAKACSGYIANEKAKAEKAAAAA